MDSVVRIGFRDTETETLNDTPNMTFYTISSHTESQMQIAKGMLLAEGMAEKLDGLLGKSSFDDLIEIAKEMSMSPNGCEWGNPLIEFFPVSSKSHYSEDAPDGFYLSYYGDELVVIGNAVHLGRWIPDQGDVILEFDFEVMRLLKKADCFSVDGKLLHLKEFRANFVVLTDKHGDEEHCFRVPYAMAKDGYIFIENVEWGHETLIPLTTLK